MKDLLITHTDLDGISPIILMNLTNIKFDHKSIEINQIDETFQELENEINNYNNIYITDLSLTEYAYSILEKHENVFVFDHHETHLWANKYSFVNVILDINGVQTCGTELFYNFLKNKYGELNKEIIKEYVQLVRELDTYNFTSETPKELEELRVSYGKTDFIKLMTKRLKKDKEHFEFTSFEKRLIKLKKNEIEKYIFKKDLKLIKYEINGLQCGIVFAERFKSELGNELNKLHPELDLIIIYDAGAAVSYRTIKDDIKVNEFASIYGGGGHLKASGSRITDETKDLIIKNYFENEKIKIKKLTSEES